MKHKPRSHYRYNVSQPERQSARQFRDLSIQAAKDHRCIIAKKCHYVRDLFVRLAIH